MRILKGDQEVWFFVNIDQLVIAWHRISSQIRIDKPHDNGYKIKSQSSKSTYTISRE